MADHPDVDIIRRGHQAFNERDFDTLRQCFTDDIRWHTGGRSPMAGTIEGRDALMRDFFEANRDAPLSVNTMDVLANGRHLVSIAQVLVGQGDQQHSFLFTEVCHTRDGQISERWALLEDQAGFDELLAQMLGT